MEPKAPQYFEREHRRLEAKLHEHLLRVVAGELDSALQYLLTWRQALAKHIEIEETWLFPHIPEDARWQARLYLLEHERITLLADEYVARVAAMVKRAPAPGQEQHQVALALIDAAHALRHLVEHHHEREEKALAHELPARVQEAAWQQLRPQTEPNDG